jgi:DMSO/TMAO reductase YedYZ molybdopterin-dependent catalytic subunit
MAVTRGFVGRRPADSSRVPPGQDLTRDFPVRSAGPMPYTPPDTWDLTIRGTGDQPVSLSWPEFQALPHEKVTVDIHCVTKWTKIAAAGMVALGHDPGRIRTERFGRAGV